MKIARWIIVIAVLMTALLSACGPSTPPATPTPTEPQGDAIKGQEAFAKTCVSCHGPDAKGMPGLGKDLTTSEFVRSLSNLQLVEFIKTGRPASDPANTQGVDMPPRGGNPALTDQDILNIVAYLRKLQQ